MEDNMPVSFESESRLRTVKRWVNELAGEGLDKNVAAQVCMMAHNDLWQKPVQMVPYQFPVPPAEKPLTNYPQSTNAVQPEVVWDGNSDARPPAPPGFVEAEAWVELKAQEYKAVQEYAAKTVTAEEVMDMLKWPDHPGSIIPQRGAPSGEEPPEVV